MESSVPTIYSSLANHLKKEDKEEHVINPHDHDVLCGRGGLTNHHPGNTWYRRLVRSNRALYKKSPKHTKLLVSKAIVHHVLSQDPSGRFLECHKTTGLWYPVPYKRAVEKTSQALRERERDGEDEEDDDDPQDTSCTLGTESYSIALAPPPTANSIVAQTVSSSAQLTMPLPPPPGGKRTLERGSSWFAFAKRQKTGEETVPLPTVPLQQRSSSIFRFFQTSAIFGGSQAPAPPVNSFQQPPSYSFNGPATLPSFGQQMVSTGATQFNQVTSTSPLETTDFRLPQLSGFSPNIPATSFGQEISKGMAISKFGQVPSSNGMQMPVSNFGQGTSSVGTQLASSTTSGFSEQPNGTIPIFAASQGYNQGYSSQDKNTAVHAQSTSAYGSTGFSSSQEQTINHAAAQLQSTFSYSSARFPTDSSQGFPPSFELSQEYEPRPLDTDFKTSQPSLTRFTTQVSDWLTSFWPLNREPSGEVSQNQLQQRRQQQLHQTDQSFSNNMHQTQLQQIQLSQDIMQRHMQQEVSPQMQHSLSQQLQQSLSHQIQQGLSQGHRQSISTHLPPELNPSLSSTFLKFATNPSRLLSGLSTLFDRGGQSQQQAGPSTGLCDENDLIHSNAAIHDCQAQGLGNKPSSGRSLLDDYEETAMETRLRTVHSR